MEEKSKLLFAARIYYIIRLEKWEHTITTSYRKQILQ